MDSGEKKEVNLKSISDLMEVFNSGYVSGKEAIKKIPPPFIHEDVGEEEGEGDEVVDSSFDLEGREEGREEGEGGEKSGVVEDEEKEFEEELKRLSKELGVSECDLREGFKHESSEHPRLSKIDALVVAADHMRGHKDYYRKLKEFEDSLELGKEEEERGKLEKERELGGEDEERERLERRRRELERRRGELEREVEEGRVPDIRKSQDKIIKDLTEKVSVVGRGLNRDMAEDLARKVNGTVLSDDKEEGKYMVVVTELEEAVVFVGDVVLDKDIIRKDNNEVFAKKGDSVGVSYEELEDGTVFVYLQSKEGSWYYLKFNNREEASKDGWPVPVRESMLEKEMCPSISVKKGGVSIKAGHDEKVRKEKEKGKGRGVGVVKESDFSPPSWVSKENLKIWEEAVGLVKESELGGDARVAAIAKYFEILRRG